MPSEVDQAAPQQSVEARLGSFFGAPEEPEVDTAPDQEVTDQVEESDDEETTQPEAPAVDEIEIEVEGWKGKIPAKLKAEIDKGADYTRKTQALADERRLIETQVRSQQEQSAFMQSVSKEIEKLRQIETQLDQYKQVDLSQIDGETLSRMSIEAGNLREERGMLQDALKEKRGEFRKHVLSNWDDLTNKALTVISKDIPNWSSVASDVAQFAIKEGYQFEAITGHDRQTHERVGPGVIDPVFARTLYKAMQWDKLQASKATTPGKVANAPPVVKPGAPTNVLAANRQKTLMQQHKQKGSVDSAAALLKRYFKDS